MTRNELLDLARRAGGVTLVGNGRKLTDEQVYQMIQAAYERGAEDLAYEARTLEATLDASINAARRAP